jgi:hypothetical protein
MPHSMPLDRFNMVHPTTAGVRRGWLLSDGFRHCYSRPPTTPYTQTLQLIAATQEGGLFQIVALLGKLWLWCGCSPGTSHALSFKL